MIVAVSITAVLVVYLRRIARETGSLILAADTLHYQSDLYTNIGIIAAFLLIKIFNIPLLDPIVSIIVAIYIMF
jgi:divalent metal cation (Fe/Co/Zn/Cd) transporter